MTIEIKWTGSKEYGQYVKMCLGGPPGVGKTRWSCLTSPNPLLLNAEAGTMSIADAQIPSIQIGHSDDLVQARNLLSLGQAAVEKHIGFPVETVVLDTFDEIARILMNERMTHQKKDSFGPSDWSWLGDQLNAIIRGFRDLDMHVIFNCHIKDVQDGDSGATSYKLDISGATAHQLPAAVDLAVLMHYELVEDPEGEEDSVRRPVIMTAPDPGHEWVKDRSGKLAHTIVANFETGFADIVASIFEGVDIAESKTKVIDFSEEDMIDVDPEPSTEAPTAPRTPEEAAAQTAAAEKTIAAAEAAADEKMASLFDEPESSPVLDVNDLDLAQFDPPQAITIDGDKGFDFKPDDDNRVQPIAGRRWVIETTDNKRVLSLNQVQEGVLVQPSGVGPGYYCQETGVEVPKQQADISRIRFRRILSEEAFAARNQTK